MNGSNLEAKGSKQRMEPMADRGTSRVPPIRWYDKAMRGWERPTSWCPTCGRDYEGSVREHVAEAEHIAYLNKIPSNRFLYQKELDA